MRAAAYMGANIMEYYENAARIALRERMKAYLNEKDERTRTIFYMRANGYSYREIGERLKMSEGAARTVHYRTRKQMRNQLLREGYDIKDMQ